MAEDQKATTHVVVTGETEIRRVVCEELKFTTIHRQAHIQQPQAQPQPPQPASSFPFGSTFSAQQPYFTPPTNVSGKKKIQPLRLKPYILQKQSSTNVVLRAILYILLS